MLSVAKLTPGQEGYYERSVAAGIDDYYAGRGESPGVWTGRGALALGARRRGRGGPARSADPRPSTRRPASSCAGAARERARITIERIDPATGERRLEEKTLRPVAGFDLVFSVPEERQPAARPRRRGDPPRRQRGTHRRLAGRARLPRGRGVRRPPRRRRRRCASTPTGFVAAAYQHRTSRAQDPHLHTHVIVANMAQAPSDGKWRALDGEAILKTYRLAAGYLYQAQLRAELSRSLGVEWETPTKGMADLEGVPRQRRRGVLDPAGAGRRAAWPSSETRRLLRRPGRRGRDPRAQGARRPRPAAARTGARAPPSTDSGGQSSTRSSTARAVGSSPRASCSSSPGGCSGPTA